jgi:hypothetical protein
VLVASAPGCCATGGPYALGGYDALSGPSYAACRGPYTPGYPRPCFPAYRPIDSVSSP